MSDNFCLVCARTHSQVGETCSNPICMGACKNLCVRGVGCHWAPEVQPKAVVDVPAPAAVQLALDSSLKDAFEAWLASTEGLKVLLDPGILYQEFEEYAQERLVAVDQAKNYLQVVHKGDKMSLQQLDKERLYRNQNGKYVLMEGKRRVRVGSVAVMEG
jgi:hypothetical protein